MKVYPSNRKPASQLRPGDVLSSGYVVSRIWPSGLMCAPKGKLCIEGNYPGKPIYHSHWGKTTSI